MARFEFRDDDDDEDTDCDSPQKEHWDSAHEHRRFQQNNYGEQEEGEIIEDESSGNEMGEMGEYGDGDHSSTANYNYNYNQNTNDCENFQNQRFSEEESPEGFDSRNRVRSFQSYLPWRSRRRSRRRSPERSPSPGNSSLRSGSSRDGDHLSHDNETHNVQNGGNDDNNTDHKEGDEEYRLIASSKYDRNYERSDFYPSGIHSNNSYESSNSNSYTNPVSDDDENDDPYGRGYNSERYRNESSSNSVHQRPNGALVRSSSHQNSSNGAPEVHYHIYVSERQASQWFDSSGNYGPPRLSQEENLECENDTANNKRSISLWKRITLLAAMTQFLVFLVNRYDLVTLSPPPSYLTWEEYRSHQFRLVRKVSKEGFSLFKHLATVTAFNTFITNNEDENANSESPRYSFPKKWKSFSPLQGTKKFESRNSGNQKIAIFGQEESLEHLRNGLSLWSSSQKFHPIDQNWRHQSNPSFDSQQGPLIVYASGERGVGKGSLAYLLLEQLESFGTNVDAASVLGECAAASAASKAMAEDRFDGDFYDKTLKREYYCPLLHLTPSDYNTRNRPFEYLDEDDNISQNNNFDGNKIHMTAMKSSLFPLYEKILDHVVAAGGGASIVVFEKVDSPDLPLLWLRDLMAEVRSQQSIFGNTIFVLTSQVGTNTVEKWTRKRLQSLQGTEDSVVVPSNTEVEALLRYELKRHHDIGSEGDDARDTYMGIENWLLVPMAPLDKNAMALILKNIAFSGSNPAFYGGEKKHRTEMTSRMILTESASHRILDALEWHQWIHKASGEVLRIWSPDGAPPLLKLWEERVLQSIESLSQCPKEEVSTKEVLVLDFEGSSTDRLWLRSCELAEEGAHFDIKSDDGRRWMCRGASCSFYL